MTTLTTLMTTLTTLTTRFLPARRDQQIYTGQLPLQGRLGTSLLSPGLVSSPVQGRSGPSFVFQEVTR